MPPISCALMNLKETDFIQKTNKGGRKRTLDFTKADFEYITFGLGISYKRQEKVTTLVQSFVIELTRMKT